MGEAPTGSAAAAEATAAPPVPPSSANGASPPPPPDVAPVAVEVPHFGVVENPLLVAWEQVTQAWSAGGLSADQLRELRRRCVEAWSWAVPNEAALHALGGLGRLVEMGAGSGYWSRLLRQRGVDVVAYDRAPGIGCTWYRDGGLGPVQHTEVVRAEPEVLQAHPDRALLLVWPPLVSHESLDDPQFVSFGRRCLSAYAGTTVAYVGEPKRVRADGNRPAWTGDDTFFDDLHRDFAAIQWVSIPRWPGLHDALWILRRRGPAHD